MVVLGVSSNLRGCTRGRWRCVGVCRRMDSVGPSRHHRLSTSRLRLRFPRPHLPPLYDILSTRIALFPPNRYRCVDLFAPHGLLLPRLISNSDAFSFHAFCLTAARREVFRPLPSRFFSNIHYHPAPANRYVIGLVIFSRPHNMFPLTNDSSHYYSPSFLLILCCLVGLLSPTSSNNSVEGEWDRRGRCVYGFRVAEIIGRHRTHHLFSTSTTV